MTKSRTNYLDLDAVSPEIDVVVKLGGIEHHLAPITLDDFVQNTRAVQNMDAQTDPVKEMELLTAMLFRAFPSMTEKHVGGLTLQQLQTLFNFAMEHNGGNAVKKEAAAEAKTDPSQAGQ